jgi:hypothetical protein
VATPSKRSGEGETTYLDTDIRVRRAEELLCDQWSSRQIVEALIKEFSVVERTAYTYIKLAYENLSADAANDRGIRKARARATWQAQYRRCIAKGDLPAANYAMDRLCRLDGLFAPEKHVHTTTMISVSVQIDAVINVLDAAGLAALDVVLAQLDAAKARGELADAAAEEAAPADAIEILARDGKPVPIPAKGRGRKPKAKA